MTLPLALEIVKLFPVVFITGFGAALGSRVIAFAVTFTVNSFDGAVVPMYKIFDFML